MSADLDKIRMLRQADRVHQIDESLNMRGAENMRESAITKTDKVG